jgi:hypothetical protein
MNMINAQDILNITGEDNLPAFLGGDKPGEVTFRD